MNKEKLIEKMREAYHPFRHIVGELPRFVYESCAEAALKELDNEWVRVEDRLPLPIKSRVEKISKRVPFLVDGVEWFGYYDFIGQVWQAQGFKTFDKARVQEWYDLPSPPKDK